MYAVVHLEGGLLESVKLFSDEHLALQKGQLIWRDRSGFSTMHEYRELSAADMVSEEPGYDSELGGVSRGHVMHWWTDDYDIYVEYVEKAD